MPIIKKIKQINLLPLQGLDTTVFGRILKWALSSFRIMVIFTELVVMAAFLSRFWLDAKNSDLNDTLEVNKAQVMAYSDIESEFRLRQKQIAIAKTMYSDTKRSDIISNIIKLLPTDIILSTVSIEKNDLQIKAFSGSERSIVQLLTNIEDRKELDDVKLSQLSSSSNNNALIIFTISATIKN